MESLRGPLVEWATAALTRSLESESGDRHVVQPFRHGMLPAAVDGLGDGLEAGAAAAKAVNVLKRHAEELVNRTKLRPATGPLCSRERQVLQLGAEGKTTKEIASHLGISTKTADSHRARVMNKLDNHDTAGLVRCAVRTGLIRP